MNRPVSCAAIHAAVILAAAGSLAGVAASAAPATAGAHGIDLVAIDRSVAPGNDDRVRVW